MLITKEYLENLNSDIIIEQEVWKPIHGYEEVFEASNYGNIRRLPYEVSYRRKDSDKIAVRHLDYHTFSVNFKEDGYLACNVGVTELSCHRAVALAFLDVPQDYMHMEVDHIDFNSSNPYYKNLQWVTPKQNKLRSYENVLKKNGRSIREIKSGKVYASIDSFCKLNNLKEGTVDASIVKYHGYIPRYDLLVEDFDYSYVGQIIHTNDDATRMFEARAEAIRNLSHQGVKCLETNEIYPSAQFACKALGIPPGSVNDALILYNGFYKKHNLHFESIEWQNATYEDIKEVIPYYLNIFAHRGKKASV